MGIAYNIGKALQALGNNIVTARDSMKVMWSEPPRRTTDLWANYFHVSPMLNPVHMIASDVATASYKIYNKANYRRDEQNAVPFYDNPIYDVLDHPMLDHPEIGYFELMFLTSSYYEVLGEAFWLVDRDARGRPVGVYIIPPNWCLLTPTRDIPFFRIQPMGNTSHIYFNADPADVVWFKSPNAVNPYGRGRGNAEPLGDEIETHEFSSKFAKNLFYNDATPPIILEMPGISKQQADEFKENWVQRLGGYLNARKPGIVGQKDFKVHQLTNSPREMDFTESRKYLIQMANEQWCVPPEMRGNLQNSNRATIDSAFYLWAKNVVTKRLHLFSLILNNQFVPMFDKTLLWKFDEIVPEDKEAMMKIANDGLEKGTLTRNEWRMIASKCGVVLKPDTKRGDVYLMGLMTQEVTANKKEIEAPEPAKEETAKPEPKEEPAKEPEKAIDMDAVIKELEAIQGTLPATKYGKDMANTSKYTDEQKLAFWKAFDKAATAHENTFQSCVKKFADKQNALVKGELKNIESVDEVQKALDNVFTKDADIALKRAIAPAWLATMREGKSVALLSLNGKKSFEADDTAYNVLFNKWVDKYGLMKATEMNETTKKKLSAAISDSIETGDSLRETIKKVMEACDGVYEEMTTTRAANIAQTESCSSENYGIVATYKAEGVKTKTWLATMDGRTRESHDGANGQTVGIDESFIVDGEKMEYPGDFAGSAENVCRCRCTTMAGEED